MSVIKLSISGLNAAICNKPKGFNMWVIKCYDKNTEKRTLKQFYSELLFNFTF